MSLFFVVIVLALLATGISLLLGLIAMSSPRTDQIAGTPLMWARIGCQALTILLLVLAFAIKGGS